MGWHGWDSTFMIFKGSSQRATMSTNMLAVTSYLLMEQYLRDLISFSSHFIRLFPEIFALLSYANKSIVPSISKIQLDWPALRHQAKSSFLRWEFMSLCISDSEHIFTILWLTFLIENQSTTYFRSVQESGFCDIDYVITIDRGPRDLADQLTLFKSGGHYVFKWILRGHMVLKYHRRPWGNIFDTDICRSMNIPKNAKYTTCRYLWI